MCCHTNYEKNQLANENQELSDNSKITTYGQFEKGTITTAILPYSQTKNKKITIWTPPLYDAKDKDTKYGVLYMTDGQNLFGNDPKCSPVDWGVDDTILSMMKNGKEGIIVVGIDNSDGNRNSELTPDIGEVISSYADDYAIRTGEDYAKFVVNTVCPYIEDNYNVYTDNFHRGFAGSSSGGIEAFYIGMKYPDKFDYIGALSPAFLLFHEDTWDRYLNTFDFRKETKLPRIYIYNGKGDGLEKELYPYAVAMEGWLKNIGYPSDNIKTSILDSGLHNETYWQIVFPEILCWCLKY